MLNKGKYIFETHPFFLKNMMWERWAEREELAKLAAGAHKTQIPPEILEKERQLREIELKKLQADESYNEAETKSSQLIENSKKEAGKIMEETVLEAQNLKKKFLDEAEQQSAEIREAAYSKGYEQGSEKGEKEGAIKGNAKGLEQWSAIVGKWEKMTEKVLIDKKELMEKAEPTLINLATQIAEKVIDASLLLDKEIVLRQVQKSLKEVVEREWIRIRLHPSDIQEVRQHKGKFLAETDLKNIEIVEDASVGQGGCIIETPSGNIDARLKTQLDRISQHLEL